MPRSAHQPVVTRPLPSTRLPLLVVLLLLAGVVLVYLCYLQPKGKLLGPPIHENTYEPYLSAPMPKAPILRSDPPPAPPSTAVPSLPPAGQAAVPVHPAAHGTPTPAPAPSHAAPHIAPPATAHTND